MVLLNNGAEGLENMGRLGFLDAVQIVDFYQAMDHGGQVLQALLGGKEHPEYTPQLRRWAQTSAQGRRPETHRRAGRRPWRRDARRPWSTAARSASLLAPLCTRVTPAWARNCRMAAS